MQDEEPGTFYLTDFLARHAEALVIRPLGLDRFPELVADVFGNYRRVVYLAQTDDPDAHRRRAQRLAERLGLDVRAAADRLRRARRLRLQASWTARAA